MQAAEYVLFDVLFYRGRSLLERPLWERRKRLHDLPDLPYVSRCEGVIRDGTAAFRSALAEGHEGVVAKKLSGPYLPNQRGWKKIKERIELACVVIGYRTRGTEVRDLVMASLIEGSPRFVGVVELGIPHGDLLRRLNGLRRSSCVPCSVPARWVNPKLFCTVRFCGWRPSGAWRDPVLFRWEA